MNKRWVIGLVLFISIALNITLGSMLIGKQASQHRQPMRMALERLDSLPEASREKAMDIVLENRAALREKMQAIRQSRQEIKAYVTSENYTRAEAEKKLAELRQKTAALQEAAQTMILDIADTLPPEERATMLQKKLETE